MFHPLELVSQIRAAFESLERRPALPHWLTPGSQDYAFHCRMSAFSWKTLPQSEITIAGDAPILFTTDETQCLLPAVMIATLTRDDGDLVDTVSSWLCPPVKRGARASVKNVDLSALDGPQRIVFQRFLQWIATTYRERAPNVHRRILQSAESVLAADADGL